MDTIFLHPIFNSQKNMAGNILNCQIHPILVYKTTELF